jgi:AcrR family transcriptional regulator
MVKDKLIKTSIELFGEKGFSETSIQDIVNENEVTKGTFYYYFNSKEELLLKIHLDYINDLIEKQEKVFKDDSKSCREKLHDLVLTLIKNINGQGQSARVFFREMRNLKDEHLSEVVKRRDQYRENFQNLIEEGIRNGEFRNDLRPDMVTLAILGITNWSYFWYDSDGEVSEEELTRIYVSLILSGFQK